jgi:glycosyltransferase involved in cell wall biosynthesis
MEENVAMKLLICTQVLDTADSNLGFFVRWVEEFAKRCERVTVVCLRAGVYHLPNNVEVVVLESGRLTRAVQFLQLVYTKRHEYDAVFVHMNPEYVVLAGWLWRLMHKKVALWYVHKSVNVRLRLAAFFADVIFTASKESFRLASPKVRVVGHGIDVNFFKRDPDIPRGNTLLAVGRLSPSKRTDLAIEAAAYAKRRLKIIGEGPQRRALQALAEKLSAPVEFAGGVPHPELKDEYETAAVFIHTSETGSLDKVVLEALAMELPVITTSTALSALPVVVVEPNPKALAEAIFSARGNGRSYVEREHSLSKLIPTIVSELQLFRK